MKRGEGVVARLIKKMGRKEKGREEGGNKGREEWREGGTQRGRKGVIDELLFVVQNPSFSHL